MLVTVLEIIYLLLVFYWYVMMAGVILTWIPVLYNYKIPRLIRNISDWYLYPFRGKLVIGFLDFTPIIGFFLYSGILSLLYETIFIMYGI